MPLNVTYDFGKGLKILRPKHRAADGREYDFKRDGPVLAVGDVPEYLRQNAVVSNWYPRIQALVPRLTYNALPGLRCWDVTGNPGHCPGLRNGAPSGLKKRT
jgi:hypothetical protein